MVTDGSLVKAPENRRVPELDGIRGLAILLVLMWHYVACGVTDAVPGSLLERLRSAAWIGWSGVDLFFVLSGFLIGGILVDNRSATNYFRVFYTRRFCRILPLYFAWLALFVLLRALPPGLVGGVLPHRALFLGDFPPYPLLSYATFTQNFFMASGNFGIQWLGITWSLAVEEQFYLFLPFLVWIAAPRMLPWLLGICALAAPIARFWLYEKHHGGAGVPVAVYVHSFCRADALMLGALCAWGVRHERVGPFLRRHVPLLYGVLAVFGAAAVWVARNHSVMDPWMSKFGYSVMALFYASALMVAVLHQAGPVAAFFRVAPLRRLGILAYGVYLFHQGVSGAVHGLLLHATPRFGTAADIAVTLVALAATIGLAHLSWTRFEAPITAAGQRLPYERVSAPAPQQVAAG